VLYNLTPFITALLSYWWFKERMTSKKWLGLALGFSAFLPGVICDIMRGCFFKHVGPQLLTIGAVACSAYGWVLMRRLVKKKNYSPLTVNGMGMFFGGILALLTSGIFESWSPSPVVDMKAFIYLTLLIVFVANIIFYNFYSFLLKKYTATFLSFAGFLCPLFTALFGMIFLSECIDWTVFFAMGLVCVGLYIFYEEELHQGYILK
jgi:drug/metabolite transporter (DMT)-like permease